jgi:hypothetical protein
MSLAQNTHSGAAPAARRRIVDGVQIGGPRVLIMKAGGYVL